MKSLFYSLILTVIFVLFHEITHAQFATTLHFNSQTDLDNYFAANPGLTSLVDLSLSNGGEDPIINTNVLSNLTTIGTLAIFDYSASMDLSGLNNLTSLDSLTTQNVGQFDFASNITSVELLVIHSWYDILTTSFDGFDNLLTAGSIYINLSNPSNIVVNAFPSLHTLNHLSFSPYDFTNEMAHIGSFDGFHAVTAMQSLYIGENEPTAFTNLTICNSITHLNDFWAYIMLPPSVNSTICQNLDTINNFLVSGYFPFDNFTVQTIHTSYIEGSGYLTEINLPNLTTIVDLLGISTYSPLQVELPMLNDVHHMMVSGAAWWGPVSVNINMPQVTAIDGDFTFSGTLNSSLDFIENVVSIGGQVNIENNPNLSDCSVQAICNKLNIAPNDVTISGNTGACAELADVAAACFVPTITGNIYYDLNCNQIYDSEDLGVTYPLVEDDANTVIGSSNGNGGYTIVAPPNGLLTFVPIPPTGTIAATAVSIDTDALTANTTVDFALCPDGSFHDVEVNGTLGTWVRNGYNTRYYFTVKNNSFYSETTQLTVDLNLFSNYSDWNITLPYSILGSSIVFDPILLGPFEQAEVYIYGTLSNWTPLGTPANMIASISMVNTDIDPSNNFTQFNSQVVGSYDPNDMQVNRPLIDAVEADPLGDWLTYQIRFQNTGTAPAEFINVVSTQDDNVDMSTIQMIAASHANTWSFDGREVTWFFDNIQLPDSTTDLEGSQGYILFKVRTIPGLQAGDSLTTYADIYFDYNEPITTNNATTQYYLCPAPLAINSDALSVCEGETIHLQASTGYQTYAWTIDGMSISDLVTFTWDPTSTGTQTITCIAQTWPEACHTTATLTIEVWENPQTPIITQNENELTATGVGPFVWALNGEVINQSGNTISITQTGEYSVFADGPCPSQTTSGLFTYIGVDESGATDFVVYPNPALDFIQVATKNTVTITIHDMAGRMRTNQEVADKQSIDISNYPSGIYVISLFSNSQTQKRYFVKI